MQATLQMQLSELTAEQLEHLKGLFKNEENVQVIICVEDSLSPYASDEDADEDEYDEDLDDDDFDDDDDDDYFDDDDDIDEDDDDDEVEDSTSEIKTNKVVVLA